MRSDVATFRRHLTWRDLVIAVVLLILIGGAAVVYRAVRVSLEAEHTLHANYLVLDVVTSHLQRKDAA